MRKPKIENKYNLTPEVVRNLKVKDPSKITDERFFSKNSNFPGDGCIYREIGEFEDASFFLRVSKDGVIDFNFTVMMLCNYIFPEFYNFDYIDNIYELEIQELAIETINKLIDENIFKKPDKVWINRVGVLTPGGDPAWYCPVCKKGDHVYGVEHTENYSHKCSHCGANLKYPWEERDEK